MMRSILAAFLSCILVFGVLAACGTDPPASDPVDTPDASVPLDASVPMTCDSVGAALCGGACVSTKTAQPLGVHAGPGRAPRRCAPEAWLSWLGRLEPQHHAA